MLFTLPSSGRAVMWNGGSAVNVGPLGALVTILGLITANKIWVDICRDHVPRDPGQRLATGKVVAECLLGLDMGISEHVVRPRLWCFSHQCMSQRGLGIGFSCARLAVGFDVCPKLVLIST